MKNDPASNAFEEWANQYDHDSDEWLDMDASEIFKAGYAAAAVGANVGAEAVDVRSIYVECHMGIDVLDALYVAAHKLPICPIQGVVTGAIQEIQALRNVGADVGAEKHGAEKSADTSNV